MQPYDENTLGFYSREASTYVDRAANLPSSLDHFLDKLEHGAHILELGCGGGRDAAQMMARGFQVEPTDGVPAMAEEASKFLGISVRVMRFDELDARDAYGAVVANASLLHVPLAELGGILTRIWRALKPGGWHYASYKTGKAEGRDLFDRYYNQISCEVAEEKYSRAGPWAAFNINQTYEEGIYAGPSDWLHITAQK